MTDWQQPLVVALTQAEGTSVVHETVYENRFGFTDALNEMGADIVVHKEGLPGHDRRVARRPFEQAAVITGRRRCTRRTSASPTCAAASATSSRP